MSKTPLNDTEVNNEMNKMVAFIKQEALEKAREIKVKADEEFNIEKAKLVRQETIAIDLFYSKKTKQAEVQRKIAQSNHINKSRLKILQAREQMLDDLFQEGKKMLPSISKSIDYEAIVGKLILQGMYQLMEERVVIECASGELQLVTRAAKKAQQDYQQSLNLNVEYTIQEGLKESGVVLSVKEGKIRVKNTLEARLDLLSEFMLPDIRILLFGVSENRAFYN